MGQTIRADRSSGGGGGGAVDSFNARTGVVVPVNGDYNTGQVTEVVDKRYVTDAEKLKIDTIVGFDATTEGVLTDFIDSQNENSATSNATQPNLTTYLTLVATGIDINSDYRFSVSFSVSHDATNSNSVIDIKDFGASILASLYTVEPKDNANRTWVTLSGRITPNPLGGGQIQLQLDFGTDNVADDTTMYFANISLQKINE